MRASAKHPAPPWSKPLFVSLRPQTQWRRLRGSEDGLDGPAGAVLTKEIQYLSRSGVMLFGLITPLVLVFAMGGPIRSDRSVPHSLRFSDRNCLWVPAAHPPNSSTAWGTEGAGIQLYFLSPTPFRSVMLAKNLLQIGLFCLELTLVATVAILRFGAPPANFGDCDTLLGTVCFACQFGDGEYAFDCAGIPDDSDPAFARAGLGGAMGC